MSKKKKLVCGVGINDADYTVMKWETIGYENGKLKQKLVWVCPFYRRWRNLLRRCYHQPTLAQQPTYIGCSVCEEWLTLSNFKAWMETQDWEGKELDKDILFLGNKVYGPETCAFVDQRVNSFLTDGNASRGKYMIGVSWDSVTNKFRATCSRAGKSKYLGCFNTEIEAHQAWLKYKQELALELAAEQTDPRVAKALIDRYENYVTQEKELDKS